MQRRRLIAVSFAVVLAPLFAFACGSSEDDASGTGAVTLTGDADLFPSFSYDTGLQPPSSPVAAELALNAQGTATISAGAIVGAGDALYGLPGKGTIAIDGSIGFEGTLHVDVTGVASYDGPIPGLADVMIAVEGTQSFDPFSIGADVMASAPIPATQLPPIPLPGGIPGSLVLTIADGSVATVTFHPTCAGADASSAEYDGTITRGGTLVIQPSIQIDVPIVGTQTYDVPMFTVDLSSLGTSDVSATAKVSSTGPAPAGGDKASPSCMASASGGGGASVTGDVTVGTGGASSVTSSSNAPTTSNASSSSGTTDCTQLAESDCFSCFAAKHSDAALAEYNELSECVVCVACYTSSDGASQGCTPPSTMDPCDNTIGDVIACQSCATTGVCSVESNICNEDPDCLSLLNDFGSCP